MAEYLIHGAMMVNDITFCDGSCLSGIIGGGAVYAAAGAAVWSSNVMVASGCGADKECCFSPWMKRCSIGEDGILVKGERTNRFFLTYHEDGSYEEGLWGQETTAWDSIDFMILTPEELAPFCKQIKGMYNIMDVDLGYWKKLKAIKEQYHFPIMWEVATATADRAHEEDFYRIIRIVDYYSLNLHEARTLFGLTTEEEIVDHLLSLDVPVYFRAGARGAYVLREGEQLFVPSFRREGEKDPTGCGNASTAAAMIGFAEKKSMKEIGAIAAVAAAYNAMQYGPVPQIDEKMRLEALQTVKELTAVTIRQ